MYVTFKDLTISVNFLQQEFLFGIEYYVVYQQSFLVIHFAQIYIKSAQRQKRLTVYILLVAKPYYLSTDGVGCLANIRNTHLLI